jgi:DNA-binding LacI/PurR family transcriptional regulator
MSALGALRVTASQQLKVPRDISLAGFDDLSISSYLEPALTTIRQPMHDMGRQAMEVMLKWIAGEEGDDVITVKGDLIVRSSTASPNSWRRAWPLLILA